MLRVSSATKVFLGDKEVDVCKQLRRLNAWNVLKFGAITIGLLTFSQPTLAQAREQAQAVCDFDQGFCLSPPIPEQPVAQPGIDEDLRFPLPLWEGFPCKFWRKFGLGCIDSPLPTTLPSVEPPLILDLPSPELSRKQRDVLGKVA